MRGMDSKCSEVGSGRLPEGVCKSWFRVRFVQR